MQNLVPKIMGWLVVIITLALAPTINSANTAVDVAHAAATNGTLMIGLGTIVDYGAPLMIIGLLVAGGMFGVAGLRGQMQSASIRDMLEVIGAVIVVILALSMFTSVISYVNTLIVGSTGFAQTLYGVIPIVLYVGIIAGATIVVGGKYKSLRKGRRSSASGY